MTVNTAERILGLVNQGKAIIDRSELENRARTADENLEVARLLKQISDLRTGASIDEIGRQIGVTGSTYNDPVGLGGRAGDTFVKSEQYRKIADPANRSSRWSSGPVEVKANLLEGTLGSPGTGGALVQSDVRPGVVPTLFQPLTIADLIPTAQTQSNKVRVIVESVATNAAAVVPEGGTKPESTLEFDEEDEPVKKVATFLPVSDEILSDSPALQGYLNARLALFVRMQEEAQLLQGAGGDNLLGLLSEGSRRQPVRHLGCRFAQRGGSHLRGDLGLAAQLPGAGHDRHPPRRLGRPPSAQGHDRELRRRFSVRQRSATAR